MLSRYRLSRRRLLRLGAMASTYAITGGFAVTPPIMTRPIPRSGESLPIIGLGTWQTFDVGGTPSDREPLRRVLSEFARLGGQVVDASPMYGRSESVLGDLTVELGIRKRLFLATKVWTTGREAGVRQMEQSMRALRVDRVDLMQVHNLVDWRVHLPTLRQWKERGRIRYIGVTHYTRSAYDELSRVIEAEPLDFVQLNYSLAERDAEKRLLPLAQARGLAVLVNRPFAEGALFRRVQGNPLPEWAGELGCATWAQFFLKFIVSHPAVTCAIPATAKPAHLADNMAAGLSPLPDHAARERMARYFAEL